MAAAAAQVLGLRPGKLSSWTCARGWRSHYLFKDLQMSRFVESLLKTARRFNVSVSLITQGLGDFTGEGAGVALADAPLVLLMKQLHENELEHTAVRCSGCPTRK